MLHKGVRWRIENGMHVPVLNDNWIQNMELSREIKQPSLQPNALVARVGVLIGLTRSEPNPKFISGSVRFALTCATRTDSNYQPIWVKIQFGLNSNRILNRTG